ncbi:MAG: haloacid dehalogenase type II [Candidatus Acidiferrales bacterium]
MAARPKSVAFDVIGTTFSLEPVRDALVQLGVPSQALEIWFARSLRDAFALAATEAFSPFRALFENNLDELARSHSVSIGAEQKEQVLSQFAALPAHSDATEAFQLPRNASIRIFTLSNGTTAVSEKLLQKAGLMNLAERVISVDDIRVFKPRREIYLHAAQLAGIAPSDMALVATHAWDVHGAKRTGLMAGFVTREQIFPATMQVPDVTGASLLDVARALAG